MNPALVIAERMLMDKLMSNSAPLTGETKLKIVLLGFSGLMGFAAIGFALYAIYLWLAINYAPETVMLAMAGATIIISFLTINLVFGISAYKRYKIKQKREEVMKIAQDALVVANKELSEPIKESPLTAAILAIFAGFVAGDKIL